MKHGPFHPRELVRLPATGWTLLVQGVDLVLPQAQELLREFTCIPYARFDDIMVSYAPPGGGVGPHFDSYDAQIGTAMLRQMQRMIGRIGWSGADLAQFAGQYLSEPKPHVVFDVPRTPLAPKVFRIRIERHGLRLALQTRMLYRGRHIFINGEHCAVSGTAVRPLLRLADGRCLPPHTDIRDETADWLYRWYRAGYIKLDPGRSGHSVDFAAS